MGYCSWHVYGYGFCLYNLTDNGKYKFMVYAECMGWEPETLAENIADDLNQTNGCNGFWSCLDYNGELYIIFQTGYPWRFQKADFKMTEEKIDKLLTDYMISVIGIEDFNSDIIDYQEIENGG